MNVSLKALISNIDPNIDKCGSNVNFTSEQSLVRSLLLPVICNVSLFSHWKVKNPPGKDSASCQIHRYTQA